ncbi:MAG: RNA polymerase sigma factor, partial [Waterburya sp.]
DKNEALKFIKGESNLVPEYKTHYTLSWYEFYMDTMSLIKLSIKRHISILNLTHISSFEDVQNNIYIILFNLENSDKLIFQPENKTFIYIKQDGSRNEIANFPAWCRTISFNYLKQLRQEQNKIDSDVNIDIDNAYFRNLVCTKTIMSHLDYEEVKDKIKLLDNLDRRIIELYFFEEYKFEEISNKLEEEGFGIFSMATLRQRKSRALGKLRRLFLPITN